MSAFHYRAYKKEENDKEVVYMLNTDFVLDADDYFEVRIDKTSREVVNLEEIKANIDYFEHAQRPMGWLCAKCSSDGNLFEEELRHYA